MADIRTTYDSNNPNGILGDSDKLSIDSLNQEQAEFRKRAQQRKLVRDKLRQKEAELEKTKKELAEAEARHDEYEISRLKRREIYYLDAIASNEDHEKELAREQQALNKAIKYHHDVLKREYGIEINTLNRADEIIQDAERELNLLDAKARQVRMDASKSQIDKTVELEDIEKEKRAQRNRQRKARGENSEEFDNVIDLFGGKDKGIGKLLNEVVGEDATMSAISDVKGLFGGLFEGATGAIGEALGVAFPEVAVIAEGVKQVVKITSAVVDALNGVRNVMTSAINNAVKFQEQYYGRISANVEGSQYSWDKITADAENALGLSRLVKQTDYLKNISELTDQGLMTDLEQRALLQTIKDKTLTSFDISNDALKRLIRLGETDSINQFGIELQLKRILNSKFMDSGYLSSLFDTVTSAIMTAGVASKSDITNFNSTVQTWLGAMYSSGLSDNVVSAIAQGINALGSGNVNALAQDENIQRLFLLSMDRINMDYADILQQGLSSSDTNKLLRSIVEYLNEIATNTNDNLVLKSSYSSLFNLDVSDMQAIQNVYKQVDSISSSIINASQAQNLTKQAVSQNVSAYTLAAEQFENFYDNFSYSFGNEIADNAKTYTWYRLSDMAYNFLDSLSGSGGKLGKAISKAKVVPAAIQFALGFENFIPMLTEIGTATNSGNSLLNLLETSSSTTTSQSSIKTLMASEKYNTTTRIGSLAAGELGDWEGEEEDKVLTELKKVTQALMKLKEGDGYAFAVSVEGMNNEVLRSFASIFADEDAMMATFSGDNTVLEKALFEYFDDTTSNSTEAK